MVHMIKRLFIPNYENTSDPEVRARYGTVSGVVGIITNILLAGVKMALGMIFNAIAIVADGINNLSDSLSSIITMIGFKMSSKQADEDHPYGHGRMEYVTTMLISMIMVVVGFTLAQESFGKILHPEKMRHSLLVYIALILSIAVKLWQGLFYRSMGKAIDSDTLKANCQDSMNDVLSTTAILVSLVIAYFTGYNTDGVMGVAVALFIIWSGIMLMKDTIQILLGEGATEELARDIKGFIMSYDGIVGVHDLEVHNYGPGRMFASAHAEVPAEQDVLESHDLIDNIEREMKQKRDIQLTIHMDPIVTSDPELDLLRQEIQVIVKELGEHVSYHDLRLVRGTTHTNVLFDIVVPFQFQMTEEQIKNQVSARIRERHPNYFTVVSIDRDFIKRG